MTNKSKEYIYIGSTGRLNELLYGYLESESSSVRLYSARSPIEKLCRIDDAIPVVVVFGGRTAAGWEEVFKELKEGDTFVYLNTFIYGDVIDSYQLAKLTERERISKLIDENVNFLDLRIPFVEELLPSVFVQLRSGRDDAASNSRTFVTSIADVSDQIVKGKEALATQSVGICMPLGGRLGNKLYSLLFRVFKAGQKSPRYLTFCKIMERIVSKVFVSKVISITYIQQSE